MANQFKNFRTQSVGTQPVDVYTPASTATSTVIGINCANKSTSNIEVDIKIRDAASDEFFISKGVIVPRNSALAAMGGDQKLVVEPGQSLTVRANKDDSVDVVVSVLEIIG